MSLKERVYSILVVSAAEKFNASLAELLPEAHYRPVETVKSISEAKRIIAERSFDFVFINTPLPDDFGIRFAIDVSSMKNAVVLLFVKSEIYGDVLDKVVEYGVFVLSKPAAKPIVAQALEWMASARERIRAHEIRTQTLEDKMAEIRIVNRAKLLLISELHMDEAQAHRYIEKSAMDRCVTKRVIAEEIIRTYSYS
ncbi:MAG TPA: ANTAR domain-containing protein [Candidatus Avimonas sp.]|nr:ANTAR domain-containing protein [Candidatus Avimonas sp.]